MTKRRSQHIDRRGNAIDHLCAELGLDRRKLEQIERSVKSASAFARVIRNVREARARARTGEVDMVEVKPGVWAPRTRNPVLTETSALGRLGRVIDAFVELGEVTNARRPR